MEEHSLTFRRARLADLERVVQLLAVDPLGRERESFTTPLERGYLQAFASIDADPNNELVVVERGGVIIGVLQITFIPSITYRGSWRALIEGVRVAAEARSAGVGRHLILWAIDRARDRGCALVQLTSDKARPDAIRFYQSLGFSPSHEGMKLRLQPLPGGAHPVVRPTGTSPADR
jgi:GNAT superfamily N-acetyltransferase